MPQLRHKGRVVAVLSQDSYQLHPDLLALEFDDPERLAVEQTAETLLNVREITGEFLSATRPAARS